MPKVRDLVLDQYVLSLLDGTRLEAKADMAMQLISVGSDDVPRIALVSVGEVVALDEGHLRLALWESSETTANVRRRKTALLSLVAGNSHYAIELSVMPATGALEVPGLVVFDAEVVHADRDSAAYAEVTGGIAFRLFNPAPVLARWERTVEVLRTTP